MLNGMNDKLFPDATTDENNQFTMVRLLVSFSVDIFNAIKEGRFEDNYGNRAIFKMKVKALKVMDLFLNFRFYLRLQVGIMYHRECNHTVSPLAFHL